MGNGNRKIGWLIIIFALVIVSIIYALPHFIKDDNTSSKPVLTKNNIDDSISLNKKIEEASKPDDSVYHVIRMSQPLDRGIPYTYDNIKGQKVKRIYTGRRINIAIIGVDSRLGQRVKHADANHIISILLDSGKIEITSIPRDTPADAGMSDSSHQNKLTIVRATRGLKAYLSEAANIAGLDKIPYYVEVGFSQVIGILDLLGYSNPKSTLQVFRSRTGLGGDDYQRSYNQGQFIRQTILRHFEKIDGLLGEMLIRGGLAIVETNLTTAKVKEIVTALNEKGFLKSDDDVFIRLRPPMTMKFKIYDFTDESIISKLVNRIESFNEIHLVDSLKTEPRNVLFVLQRAIKSALRDSAKSPTKVITKLKTYYDQRAWHQIDNKILRDSTRNSLCTLLANAYFKKKDIKNSELVRMTLKNEEELFKAEIFKKKFQNDIQQ